MSTAVKRFPPNDPREWLNRARSSLAKASSGGATPEIYFEDLCFDAQQAAEKAIKAVLIHLGVRFPYVHDLAQLLTLVVQTGQAIPGSVKQAAILSEYAVQTRYPGLAEPVTLVEYEQAVAIAGDVVHWLRALLVNRLTRQEDIDMPKDSIAVQPIALTAAKGSTAAATPTPEIAISARKVSKMYPLHTDPAETKYSGDRLRQSLWYALPKFLRGQPREFYQEFWARREV